MLFEAAKQVPEVNPALAWGQVVFVAPVAVGEPHLLTAGYPQLVQEPVDAFWDGPYPRSAVNSIAPKTGSLNLSLRHEVARLIVWRVVRTRPAVPSAVSYEDVRGGNDPYRALGHGPHSL